MKHINGLAIQDDIEHVQRLTGEEIVEAIPAPRKGEKINPHCSRFITTSGKIIDCLSIKPVYYADKDENWRPLSEIADEFGNHYIKLKANWKTKMHPKFLRWISKRMDLLNEGKSDEIVLERHEDKTPKRIVPSGLSEFRVNKYEKLSNIEINALIKEL